MLASHWNWRAADLALRALASAQTRVPKCRSAPGIPVELDPVRFLRQVSTISDELVAHLGNAVRAPPHTRAGRRAGGGFPDDVQRTIRENAATLKFDSHEFEG
jgi:hypothetical protein